MRLRKAATILAASLSLASTPVLAQSSAARAGAQMVEPSLQEENEGINGDWIIPGVIFIGVIVTLILIYTGDDDQGNSPPTSP
jgi:hypothetical protein